jgi:hypothetical protein
VTLAVDRFMAMTIENYASCTNKSGFSLDLG